MGEREVEEGRLCVVRRNEEEKEEEAGRWREATLIYREGRRPWALTHTRRLPDYSGWADKPLESSTRHNLIQPCALPCLLKIARGLLCSLCLCLFFYSLFFTLYCPASLSMLDVLPRAIFVTPGLCRHSMLIAAITVKCRSHASGNDAGIPG